MFGDAIISFRKLLHLDFESGGFLIMPQGIALFKQSLQLVFIPNLPNKA